MTVFIIVCVFLFHGLLVNVIVTRGEAEVDKHEGFPASELKNDGLDLSLLGVPDEEMDEFSGTAPNEELGTIFGQPPCPEMLPALNPITSTASECDKSIASVGNSEVFAPINIEHEESDTNKMIPKKVILGAILADAIMAEKGAEIDAKLAELYACVDAEMAKLSPLINKQTKLTEADTSEIDSYVDSALLEIESQIASELAMIDEIVESELERTETLVKSIIKNAEQDISSTTISETSNASDIADMIANETDKEKSVELELAKLESFIESQLTKTESIVNSELEKIYEFVESELAQVDKIVERELAKVESFVGMELAKTDAVLKSELSKVETFVDAELQKVEIPVEGIVEFRGKIPAYGSATIIGSCDYPPVSSNMEGSINDDLLSQGEPLNYVQINGTFPAFGRTLILGHTECPPILPTAEPLPIYTESFPVETFDYQYPYAEDFKTEDVLCDDVLEIPVAGQVSFNGVSPAVGSCKILGTTTWDPMLPLMNKAQNPPTVGPANLLISTNSTVPCGITNLDALQPYIKILPRVNLIRVPSADDRNLDGAIINGDLEFSGTARATGRASVYAEFPCAPLTATEEGPNGKKYIWISKKHTNNDSSQRPKLQPKPEFPTYPADFPETIIMDSSKNYEKLMSEDMNVDFGVLGPVLVNREATFEGIAPAFGAVSIRGHSA